ncbi:TonB-linked outer membrane protein, SusC/RagA family [Chitinophaga sp. YR573]|uniref:SusC/RagA family TonB-linked outer membrane protein n=1 Tax=Chitinophaga sp. YR573 TaxID=1881040 RepID=UPI0008AE70BB|nr:SusC/RagA family TonB-linked outer membrane protein [Chitinophaga sp. YR573]SEV97752.1 TonB-linked outer membrane protein, SusC/RagA family [Chitinophaga sp. YR573]
MKRALLFLTMLMVSVTLAYAQQRQITGKVTGADGSPLPFATVQLKGTTTGTTTDQQGSFKLTVTGSDPVILIRSVGFASQEITLGSNNAITIKLKEEDKNLQEVVVTALGITRKKNELAYSAQTVSAEELNRTRDPNVVNSLSGKVAGLEVRRNSTMGGSTNIVLRGNKSFQNSNQALFVVDGVPIDNSTTNTSDQASGRGGFDYGNAAADINPDDVQSINVLKGAAAAALYGSRAANGVIMITTKKGRKGLGVTVNIGGTIGTMDKSTFPKYQKQYGAGYYDKDDYTYESPDGYFLYRDVNGDGQKDLVVPMSEDASFGAKFDPNLMVYNYRSFDPTSPQYKKASPWVAAQHDPSYFFKNTTASNTSVTIDGGGDQGYFKLGYTKTIENGMLPNAKLAKDMLNFGASYNLTSKLTASAAVNMSKVDGKGRYGTGYDEYNPMQGFRQWWEMNVDMKQQQEDYERTKLNKSWNLQDPDNPVPIYTDNMYFMRYENYEKDNRVRYFGNVALNYKITNWLNLLGRVSMDTYTQSQEERNAVGSKNTSSYSRYDGTFGEYNYDLLLNVDKEINNNFKFTGLVGGNVRNTRVKYVREETNGGLVVPKLYSLSNSVNPIQAPVEADSAMQVNGIFASVGLGYKKMLFLDLTGRRDQSSTLPKGNNAYYYPSASLGFVFSEVVKAPWLSYGKLRVNYAQVGNSAPAQALIDAYDKPSGFGSVPLFSVPATKANAHLKPEQTKSFETGVEASFFQNRVSIDVTYYTSKSIDQILRLPVSRATGYDQIYINAGTISNKGVEVSLNVTPVKTRDFSWVVGVNWSKNKSKVLDLPSGVDFIQLGSFTLQGGITIGHAKNDAYGVIRGTDFIYDKTTGKKVVYDADGDSPGYYQKTGSANNVIGNYTPDWIGGITNTLRYKDLSLAFLVDMKHGGDVFSLDQYYGQSTGIYAESVRLNDKGKSIRDAVEDGGGIVFDGVTPDGKVNTQRVRVSGTRGLGVNGYPAKAFVYDASFIKLREVSLTYSLPVSLISHIKAFKGIDVSLLGRNLWIIHKNLPMADPEENLSAGNIQGYQSGVYPTYRTFGANLRFRF